MSHEQPAATDDEYIPDFPATVGGYPFPRPYVGRGSLRLAWEDYYFAGIGDPAVHKLDFSTMVIHDPDAEEGLRAEAVRKNDRQFELRRQFGMHRVPLEDFGVKTVYLTPEQLHFIHPDLMATLPQQDLLEVTVIHSIQDFVEELRPERRADNFNLTVDYAEQVGRSFSKQDYAHVNEHFIIGAATYTDAMAERFWRVQGNNDLRKLIAAAEGNSVLRAELSEVISLCVEYGDKTGYMLDLGKDNVLMTEQGTTKLVDALYPRDIKVLHLLGETLQKVREHELLTFQESINMLNGRKYVCAINFLAAYCGLDKRLVIPHAPEGIGIGWTWTLEMLRNLSRRHQLGMVTVAASAA